MPHLNTMGICTYVFLRRSIPRFHLAIAGINGADAPQYGSFPAQQGAGEPPRQAGLGGFQAAATGPARFGPVLFRSLTRSIGSSAAVRTGQSQSGPKAVASSAIKALDIALPTIPTDDQAPSVAISGCASPDFLPDRFAAAGICPADFQGWVCRRLSDKAGSLHL
jgi:hypothetical protein